MHTLTFKSILKIAPRVSQISRGDLPKPTVKSEK